MHSKDIFNNTLTIKTTGVGFDIYSYVMPQTVLADTFLYKDKTYSSLSNFLSDLITRKDMLVKGKGNLKKEVAVPLLKHLYQDTKNLVEITEEVSKFLDEKIDNATDFQERQSRKLKLKIELSDLLIEIIQMHEKIIHFHIEEQDSPADKAKLRKKRDALNKNIIDMFFKYKKPLADFIKYAAQLKAEQLKKDKTQDKQEELEKLEKLLSLTNPHEIMSYYRKENLKQTPEEKKYLLGFKKIVTKVIANQLTPSRNLVNLKPYYWLEKLDPHHRNIDFLKSKHQKWKKDKNTEDGFFVWMEQKGEVKNENQLDYYNSAKQRSPFLVKFDHKKEVMLGINHTSTDTKTLKEIDTTEYKGKKPGYAAYVMLPGGRLFIGPHKHHKRAHASFGEGDKVICAGMIKIKHGKIVDINNESGHYKPRIENLHLAVSIIPPKFFHKDHHVTFSTPISRSLGQFFSKRNPWFFKRIGDLLQTPFISHKYKLESFLKGFAEENSPPQNQSAIRKTK